MTNLTAFVSAILWTIPLTFASSSRCPPVNGSFFLEYPYLYPESADYDPMTCQLFLSSMYNGTLVIHDFNTSSTRTFDLPGVSHAGTDNFAQYHVDGIDYDPKSGHIFIAASDSVAFTSIISEGPGGVILTNYSNANYTGINRVLVFDPKSERLVADVSLGPAQQQFHEATGHLTSGVQDMAENIFTGDSYAIGTFGNSILKIPYQSNTSSLWYAPATYNASYGFGGIVSLGHKLIISDAISGGLVTFDTRHHHDPQPAYIPLQNLPSNYRPLNADGLYLPKKYNGRVILWSDDYNGTAAFGSLDEWKSAHFLGLIENNDPARFEGGLTTDSFEVGESVFVVNQFFEFELPPRDISNFPFYDVTEKLEGIVRGSLVGDVVGRERL